MSWRRTTTRPTAASLPRSPQEMPPRRAAAASPSKGRRSVGASPSRGAVSPPPRRTGFFARHGNVFIYVPNLIGASPGCRQGADPSVSLASPPHEGSSRCSACASPPAAKLLVVLSVHTSRRRLRPRGGSCGRIRDRARQPGARAGALPGRLCVRRAGAARRAACLAAGSSGCCENEQLMRLCQDGRFARKFNQCTTFGAVLDMVTDRCAPAAQRRAGWRAGC